MSQLTMTAIPGSTDLDDASAWIPGAFAFAFEMLDEGAVSSSSAFTPSLSMTGLDGADFDDAQWFFEIVALNDTASSQNVLLINSTGTKATITIPAGTPLAVTRLRSAAFALTAGPEIYQIVVAAESGSGNAFVYQARLVAVIGPAATKMVSQIPLTTKDIVSGTSAEGGSGILGADVLYSPGTTAPTPQSLLFNRFLFTAAHWATIAAFELEVVWSILSHGDLTFDLYDVTAGAVVAGTHIAVNDGSTVITRSTITFSASALVDGHEYELAAAFVEPTWIAGLYKARLNVKLIDLRRAEAYLMVSKNSSIVNAPTPQNRILLGGDALYYFEAVGRVQANPANFSIDLIDAASGDSGTGGGVVTGANRTFSTTRARLRSGVLSLGNGHRFMVQQNQGVSDGNDTLLSMACILGVLG